MKRIYINNAIRLFYKGNDLIAICGNDIFYIDQEHYTKKGNIRKSIENDLNRSDSLYKESKKEICYCVKNLLHNIKFVYGNDINIK
jgi:hypothetical protein